MIRIELGPHERRWRLSTIHEDGSHNNEYFKYKMFAHLRAVQHARNLHNISGQTVSLKIKGRDGRYQEERTYGPDPARTPG